MCRAKDRQKGAQWDQRARVGPRVRRLAKDQEQPKIYGWAAPQYGGPVVQ